MPTDTKVTPDRDIEIDPTGDYSTVSGRSNVEQQHVNAIYRAIEDLNLDLIGPNAAAEIEIAINGEFDVLSYVTDVREISAKREGRRSMSVTVKTDAAVVEEEVSL